MNLDRPTLHRWCLLACLAACLVSQLPRARALVPTVLHSGQIDAFTFNYEGTIEWGILVDINWDGSKATLNAHVDTLNDYFVTNLDTTFSFNLTVAFCDSSGYLNGSAYDSIGSDLSSSRVYDFSCGSFLVTCPEGCSTFSITLAYTLSSAKFSHPGTFSKAGPVPVSADWAIILGIIAALAIILGIAYVTHKRRTGPTTTRKYIRSLREIPPPATDPAPMGWWDRAPARRPREPATPDLAGYAPQLRFTPPPAIGDKDAIAAWISQQRMRAFARGGDVPSWDMLAKLLETESGLAFTPQALRDIYAAWARTKGIRYAD